MDRHAPQDDTALFDVWVATIDIDAAENVAMDVLNEHNGDPDAA